MRNSGVNSTLVTPQPYGLINLTLDQKKKNLDNDDEENNTKILRPSKTVPPAYLLGTLKVAKADDGFYHVTPDLVSVKKTSTPSKYKVTLVDITYCLEHRVTQAIENKRSHYGLLRRALLARGHILPEVVVIVACVRWIRGSIPTSALDTLRNDLGLNRAPAETILRKTRLLITRRQSVVLEAWSLPFKLLYPVLYIYTY